MSERFSFTIDRSKWYRGKGGSDSRLLSEDGCRCCVGFYLSALGVPDEQLLGGYYFPKLGVDTLPAGAKWLGENRDFNFRNVYMTNDSVSILDEATRERQISDIFAEYGVDVTFVDGAP